MRPNDKLELVHEDDTFVVVNKPAGLLSIPDRFDSNLPSIKSILRDQFGEIFTVHRLDRDTSGLICFARTSGAHSQLSTQFAAHTPEKTYLALVEGILQHQEGEINTPLAPDMKRPGRMQVIGKGGLSALTTYHVLEQFRDFALLEVKILTGRTHQIRVHLQSIGHAIVADPLYSRKKNFFLSSIKGKKFRLGKNQEERPLLSRTALHATALSFEHPISGEMLRFTVEPPKDLRASLQQLRKWNASR